MATRLVACGQILTMMEISIYGFQILFINMLVQAMVDMIIAVMFAMIPKFIKIPELPTIN